MFPRLMTALRCNVSDLLHHPASRRPVRVEIPGSELGGVAGARLSSAPLVVDVMLEHVPDGIVVHGTVEAEYESECSRCLQPVHAAFTVPVRELFERRRSRARPTHSRARRWISSCRCAIRCCSICRVPRCAAMIAPACVPHVASTTTRPAVSAIPTRPIPGGTRSRALTFDD